MNMIIIVILSILSMVIALAPIYLYFTNRKKTNFKEEIKIIAMLDVLYLVLWIVGVAGSGTLVQSPDSIIAGILAIVIPAATLFCVWKMKDGTTFKSLFKNPGINKALFVVYVIANIVIAYQLLITMLNYIIVAIAFIVIVVIADKALGIGTSSFLGTNSSDSYSPNVHKLSPGDSSCDAMVSENGVNHRLQSDGNGFKDENGDSWVKDGSGVRRF